jgi:glutamyl-tRNA synthetase
MTAQTFQSDVSTALDMTNSKIPYRGRIAPSPTGHLHVGHAMTFWRAQQRARKHHGQLILRIEDLDRDRCRPEFTTAFEHDLLWFDLSWDEGPDVGGPFAPYVQSERHELYIAAWKKLRTGGFIYPCSCSRRDVLNSAAAPHDENDEPIYPGTCRPVEGTVTDAAASSAKTWRFRVPDGEQLSFQDARFGRQSAVAGTDFGDFVVWRKDDVPAYQLAVVVDDAAMKITEVVRGADLLISTFRQLLIYRALGLQPPSFYHCELITDSTGKRLAKRDAVLSLRALRESGADPEAIRKRYGDW